MHELPMLTATPKINFDLYEAKFKALADAKRLQIINLLVQYGKICVCDLTEVMNMTQSKLSYHLKILLDANLIQVEMQGKWNYYSLNVNEVRNLLSDELCCLLTPANNCC